MQNLSPLSYKMSDLQTFLRGILAKKLSGDKILNLIISVNFGDKVPNFCV